MFRSLVSSLSIGLGILISGILLSLSISNFKNFDRYVEVKGLDEKIVKADFGTWNIQFSVSNDDLKKIYTETTNAQNKIKDFLIAQGFKQEEIKIETVNLNDNKANLYGNNAQNMPHYTAQSGINVATKNLDLLEKSGQNITALIESGILINRNFIQYSFKDLLSVKPEMLRNATANAREAAEIFAKNSNSSVGKIRQATQGSFSISSATANNNETYGGESEIMKKIRVVTSVEFFIN